MKNKRGFIIAAGLLFATACHNNQSDQGGNNSSTANANVPAFNADSAYAYTAKQVAFGPRIPNTPAQESCSAWLISKMKSFADTVYVQQTTVTGPKAQSLRCINIIASFNPRAKTRILFLTHWDTRPFADQDSVNKDKPFDGADDGASGVGVLLEMARVMKAGKPDIGVDILLEDVEDYGEEGNDNSWCLGTQYWAKHPHVPNYHANYGILLDMVGGKGSQFYMDQASLQYAGPQAKMVWDLANRLGYSDQFRYYNDPKNAVAITDDHVFVNKLTGIPTLDIVALRPDQPENIFPPWHHTHGDNMSVIDKRTLRAVGQTMLTVIYTNPAY
ncbi:MAG TPA: M28 family peptidase [Chitinophagaceae bacterium]